MIRILATLLLLIAMAQSAIARSLDPGVLEQANRAFEQGAARLDTAPDEARALLENAVAGYNAALADRDNGHLRFNLANAYALLGDTGRAALEYRRARRLLGADRDLRANFAQLGVPSSVEPSWAARLESGALFWRGLVPVRIVFWTGALAAAAFWVALALCVRRPPVRWAPHACAATGAVALVLLGSLAFEHFRDAAAPEVIVLEQTLGRKGPDDRAYEPSFGDALTPGVTARIVEDRGAWVRIRLRDGRDTWTPRSAVEPLLGAN